MRVAEVFHGRLIRSIPAAMVGSLLARVVPERWIQVTLKLRLMATGVRVLMWGLKANANSPILRMAHLYYSVRKYEDDQFRPLC